MHILRTNLDQIELSHLEALVAGRARESEVLEFKEMLPFQPQKGQPQQADRWIEQGDRVGDYARDQILAEIVAFANAAGGTLILGVAESDDQPREAIGLAPLPQCETLAQRLLDAAEDLIEPRLSSLIGRGISVDQSGAGLVVLRVARSRSGPHRLNGKQREFYIRRGERAARMDVREIKGLTLELARTGDRIAAQLEERRAEAKRAYEALPTLHTANEIPRLLIRVSAFPSIPMEVDGLTTRPGLWWQGGSFQLSLDDGKSVECGYPAREFGRSPRTRMRALFEDDHVPLTRTIRSDGLVEIMLAQGARTTQEPSGARLYIPWMVSVMVGVLAQIEHLRRANSWDGVEYGLEAELYSVRPLALRWHDRGFSDGHGRLSQSATPLRFPIYSVRQADTFNDLLVQFLQDLFNAWGKPWEGPASVDWPALIPTTS